MRALVLHGFTGSGAAMAALCDRLPGVVIAPDLVGHGDAGTPSDIGRYAMAAMVDDVAAVVAAPPVDVVGYSMGARVALSVAVARPELVRTLTLIGGTPGIADGDEAAARVVADRHLADRIEELGIGWFVDHWEERPIFASQKQLPETLREQIRSARLAQNPQGLANHLRAAGTGAMPALWHRLHEVTCPVLLLVGGRDAKFTAIAEEMAALLPAATVRIVPDVGHAAHLESPDVVADAITGFWAGR